MTIKKSLINFINPQPTAQILKKELEKYSPYGIWIFFVVFCYKYAIEITNGGHEWKTGDWLINYSSGPIRRGLAGAILLYISDFGIPLLWVTYVAQVTIYSLIFLFAIKIYKHTDRSSFWLLILFSPAFLLFPYYDLGGGFRKEIIVFAIFSYLCLNYTKNTLSNNKLAFSCLAFTFAAFSHELTAFTVPFFIFLLYSSTKKKLVSQKIALIFSFVFIAVSIISLLFAALFPGNPQSAETICSSLTSRNLDKNICAGAISWLSKDTHDAGKLILSSIGVRSIYTPIIFTLALLPLTFTTWWRKETFFLIIFSGVFFLPLFLVAVDWGRWIYILIFMVFCLALSEKLYVKLQYNRVLLIVGVFYLTTWSIPHCCVGGISDGFILKAPRSFTFTSP